MIIARKSNYVLEVLPPPIIFKFTTGSLSPNKLKVNPDHCVRLTTGGDNPLGLEATETAEPRRGGA